MSGDKAQIIATAREWIGVKFHHQGRDRHAGVDCLGLLVVIAASCGLPYGKSLLAAHDETDYGHNPDEVYLRTKLETLLTPVDISHKRAGDIALFSMDGRAQHLALLADYPHAEELSMIHAYAPARQVIEHRLDEYWQEQIVAIFRLSKD